MSWDATFFSEGAGDKKEIASFNYTHNCNRMISTVLEELGQELRLHWLIEHMGKSWFDKLDGLLGWQAVELLHTIITGLEADSVRFEAMNPLNGWGSYTSLLSVLRKMMDVSGEHLYARWEVRG